LLIGLCPDIDFSLSGRLVRATKDTEYKKLSCSNLRNGSAVKVTGVVGTDGIVIATKIEKD
jgi:hypothetical protein